MVSEGDSASSCRSKARSLQRDMEEQTSEIFWGGQGQAAGNPVGLLKMDGAARSRTSEAEEGPSPRAAEGGVPVLEAGEGGARETACPEASGRNCLPSVSEGGAVVRGRSSQKEAGQSSGEEPP
ncbi:UNVERIFIED_CONTAM: hypothetical protein FKN15_023520 [Acipenser sinensis]